MSAIVMPRASLEVGELFAGEFRVVRPLAAGGMGAVYVVEQTSTGRERALKLLKPELVVDVKARKRFHLEARIGAQVASDHVVEVVDAGIEESTKTPWIAMELLEGQDLSEWAPPRAPLPWETIDRIVAQLCHALGAAHRAGIVHRDLKPENVFIARSRRSDVDLTVKVLDFGIAKWVDEARTSGSGTQSVGTPLWMAPEQADVGPGRSHRPRTCGRSGSSSSGCSPTATTGARRTRKTARCDRCSSRCWRWSSLLRRSVRASSERRHRFRSGSTRGSRLASIAIRAVAS